MTIKEQLKKEIKSLENQIKPLQAKLDAIYRKEEKEVEWRIGMAKKGHGNFRMDELIFASLARCECGAGFAYPKGVGVWGSWYCSDILRGKAETNSSEIKHSNCRPFSMYNIKSEQQPSANGATTRSK